MVKKINLTKKEILKESTRIEECLLFSSKGHFVTATLWKYFHYFLGIPLVVSSGLLGTSVLNEVNNSQIYRIILSLLISILSALMTFTNPNENSQKHLKGGNQYDALLNKNRRFRLIVCKQEKSEKLLYEKLERIAEEKDRLNGDNPQISWLAYQIAKNGIKKGEAQYEVDNSVKVN